MISCCRCARMTTLAREMHGRFYFFLFQFLTPVFFSLLFSWKGKDQSGYKMLKTIEFNGGMRYD